MAFRFFRPPVGVKTRSNPPSETHTWRAIGSNSQDFVNAYAMSATPAIVSTVYGSLFRQDLSVRKEAYNQWSIEVPYGPHKNETGSWTWDFDTTGGTVHITTAREEVARYPSGEAPDQKGAIAVDGDEVKGTDIVIPAMKINVQFKHPLGVVTIPYAKYLNGITGTINEDPFLTFSPGEVLFLGARGADGSESEATLNYQFAMSSNAEGLTIGDIANVAKKGWDTLWTSFEDAEETAGGVTYPIKKPKFVYVDRVYREIPMAASLGFGG